ncbi:NAD(P)-binding domain-containing protein [Saccharopolyspora indica]|uniref:NADPH-dependent F420 reductase n=1 Tax=Saccharopolyspora indica TaxID=1229659 RepID=UPI0022EA2D7B|nr:NAD(P)-binding domain-containing protein [Saccharopolyspora indica]MDA3643648.1 NAD(P)-binding domain-containing protein [Saccharopolyspora indica]
MRIGILGTGNMATALGAQWAASGHELMISGRQPAKAEALAQRIGGSARAGTFAEAVEFGSVVLIAVLHGAIREVLSAAGAESGSFRDKVVIDCSNAVVPGRFVLDLPSGTSMAEQIAGQANGAKVVKAFNLCHESIWRLTPPAFDGRPLLVPLCGDDAGAVETVRSLVTDIGCEPADGGRLEHAPLLEATAAFAIGLWARGAEAQAMLPPFEAFGV